MKQFTFKAVAPKRLTDLVRFELTKRILSGKVVPDQRLPNEVELSKQFGVSLTVVKQAVSGLIALGLVYRKQGRGGGLFAQNPAPESLKALLRSYLDGQKFSRSHFQELRNAVEPVTARLAAERASDSHLRQLEDNIERFKYHATRMGKHPTRQRYNRMQDLIGDFHRIIAESTGNPLIVFVIDFLMDALASMAAELYSDYSPAVGQRIADEHRSIHEAIRKKDARAAELHMHDHINWANRELGRLEKR